MTFLLSDLHALCQRLPPSPLSVGAPIRVYLAEWLFKTLYVPVSYPEDPERGCKRSFNVIFTRWGEETEEVFTRNLNMTGKTVQVRWKYRGNFRSTEYSEPNPFHSRKVHSESPFLRNKGLVYTIKESVGLRWMYHGTWDRCLRGRRRNPNAQPEGRRKTRGSRRGPGGPGTFGQGLPMFTYSTQKDMKEFEGVRQEKKFYKVKFN